MDLREKITDAVYAHPGAPAIIDAVVEVVEEDAAKRRAYTKRRVELARKAEAAIWERRIREQKEEGNAIIAEEQDRVRELEEERDAAQDRVALLKAGARRRDAKIEDLEDENQQMRDDIAGRIFADEQQCQTAIEDDPTNAWMQGRLVGLQRARDIANT